MKDFIPGINLAQFCDDFISPDDLAWDHAMDISGSVYARLKELGMSNKDLADKLGVSAGRVSQIIKGYPGMSLKMLAKLEVALGFRLDAGFSYPGESASCVSTIEIPRLKNNVNLRDETTCKPCGSLDLSICKGGLRAA